MHSDIRERLATTLAPKSWSELFELLNLQKQPWVFCLDEFPYLVASDPSLPSILQRWMDHEKPERGLLVLSGSSTRMMNDLFLNRAAPLYGRAQKLLHIRPMGYAAFCKACHLKPGDRESFVRFSLVGGIPKYWEFVDPKVKAPALAEELFFGFSPYLEQEPGPNTPRRYLKIFTGGYTQMPHATGKKTWNLIWCVTIRTAANRRS